VLRPEAVLADGEGALVERPSLAIPRYGNDSQEIWPLRDDAERFQQLRRVIAG
jgi:hypothetical protein